MFHLDYDGYGEGEEWNTSKKRRYLFYGLKDILVGCELSFKQQTWINSVVAEYMYTKYQSGPVYHDRTVSFSDHVGGIDDYYNHYIFTGWQHWGQVMGNPLYRSPIYNNDGQIDVQNNRFVACHFALAGDYIENMNYRLMATFQKGLGIYRNPYTKEQSNISLMADVAYHFPKGWNAEVAAGCDIGRIYGHNWGFQFTVSKTGLIGKKK